MKKSKYKKTNEARKISETLMDFAKPLTDIIVETNAQEHLEQVFQIAVAVWNCVVLSMVKKDNKYIEMLRDLKAGEEEILGGFSIIEALISRKKDLFADDLRAIGDFSIRNSGGNLIVRAEARAVNGTAIN